MAVTDPVELSAWNCFKDFSKLPQFRNHTFSFRGELVAGDSRVNASSRMSFVEAFKAWRRVDYYSIAQVAETCPAETIGKNIKKLIFTHHPDKVRTKVVSTDPGQLTLEEATEVSAQLNLAKRRSSQ